MVVTASQNRPRTGTAIGRTMRAVVDDRDLPGESVLQKKMNRLLYAYGNWIFNFKGLYFTKSRFGGTVIKTFGAHREMMPAFPFLVMFKLSNFM